MSGGKLVYIGETFQCRKRERYYIHYRGGECVEDREIVEMFFGRDEAAIGAIRLKYGALCHNVADAVLKNNEDAEECVNDAYLALWNRIPPEKPQNLCAYLMKTVRNICIDRLKSRDAQKRGGGSVSETIDELAELLPSDNSVENEIETRELSHEISAFLRTITKDDRLIFTYRYWLALPTAEIARRLGFSDSRVRSSLSRTRRKLKKHLEKEGFL